ncbi:hypothetical protein [Crenalkalicoccus roseus]|uniref:hypothetical protein n=1 Tax=Crenalkalicoccus roseus TaxID=1485588 RepID=UPI00108096C1|nr:hypothetical protein [Crenalkalicoccus roseus]
MPEPPPAGPGESYTFSGTFHGPVFVRNTFQQAVTIAAGLPAAPEQRQALEKALAELAALLETLPEAQQPLAKEAAESARKVVEAAKPEGQQGFFAVAAKTLRGWAEEIGKTAPAVIAAAEAVILLVGKIRGWV